MALQQISLDEYFRLYGEDVRLINKETLAYWIAQGKSPAQIFAICMGTAWKRELPTRES
jgi:hypothetical protein